MRRSSRPPGFLPSPPDGRLAPDFVPVEKSVLCAMLLDAAAIAQARDLLSAGDFSTESHRLIYAAMLALADRQEPIDLHTLHAELARRGDLDRVGGPPALAGLMEQATTSANVEAHARIVLEHAENRRASEWTRATQQAIDAAPDEASRILSERIAAATNGPTPASADGAEPGRLLEASLSGDEILAHEFPRRTPLLGEGIISAGDLVLIFGRAKAGKTWATMQLALAMARGEKWFGITTTSELVNVGFLELELLGDAMQSRLRALGGAIPDTFHLVVRPALRGPFDLVNEDGVPVHLDQLRAWIEERGLKVVFVDALARATSCPQVDFSPLLLALDSLRADLGVCIVLVHHEGKPPRNGAVEADDLDSMRGDSRLSGFPQCVMRVVKKAGNLYSIRFAGVSNGPTPEPLFFTLGPDGVPHQVDAPESIAAGNRERILATVRAAGEPISSGKVAELAKLSDSTVRQHLGDLVADGSITRMGDGRATRYISKSADTAESAERYDPADVTPCFQEECDA
jgi:replicative DNA helicase